jgi:Tfp pilus assembly protein PilF/SAM-dependent methyltransferase
MGHHQAGRLDEAVACYRQMLALEPNLAGAHFNLGNALWALGKHEKAEASYRHALSLQPDLVSAHNNLGTILLERNQLEEAVACYRAALASAPDYAEALNNLGAALCRQEKLAEGEACIRRALALKPSFVGAHDNLGTLLREKGEYHEAEASIRRALALAPDFPPALENLGALLKDQGRWDEAISVYRQLLQIKPQDREALNGLAWALAAQGNAAAALKAIHQSLAIEETANAKRTFVDIVKPLRWRGDDIQTRRTLARALIEPWARPAELAATAARLIKQADIGPCIARAAQAWPKQLTAEELFGSQDPARLASDPLLLALLVSAQNTDIELERFLTMARRLLLEAADGEESGGSVPALEFHAALARQCFINEYVFFHGDEEIHRARRLRDALVLSLEQGMAISPLRLLAAAAYFPLHSLSGASRLMDMAWPACITAVLTQQVREPEEEAQMRASIARLTPIEDGVSRLVQSQYEQNPYPRWIRMPPAAKRHTIAGYLRRRFPLAVFERQNGDGTAEFLSVGCGTGQLPLRIAQDVKARVLAVDLSLASLAYAKRKAQELGLTGIEFAQGDLLELATIARSFDVVECSGVLHHLADPFRGWRALLSLLRPGGFMLVGLYSEMARRGIAEAREFIAKKDYGPSADAIRRCRQDLLDMDRAGKLGTRFGDFFGLSTCRDLLFHVQEQQMRLPDIAAFLKENGLIFLGFETHDANIQAYRRRFPDDPAATDLDHWREFENSHPDTFSGMYVFWVQKNP